MAESTLAELLKFQMADRAPASEPAKPPQNEMIAQAILGLAPILAGAALGGAKGGAIGAEAGLTGLAKLEAGKKEERERADKLRAQEKERLTTALLLSKEARAEEAEKRAEKREARQMGIDQQKIDIERQKLQLDLGTGRRQLEQLSPENKIMVENLSKDSATKTAIANEISQTVALFDDPKISVDQKIKAGQSLLKVLNSTQGSDAVGIEESKRLGSFLEFQIFNLTGPGKMFGRDLEGFRNQAANVVNRLSGAVSGNRDLIQQAMANIPPQVKKIALAEEKPFTTMPFGPTKEAIAAPPGFFGNSIMQNGVEYRWNKELGRYE